MNSDKLSWSFEKFYDSINGEMMSILDIDFFIEKLNPANLISDEKLQKSYTLIFLNSSYDDKIRHYEAVFKYVTGFYIYLYRELDTEPFKLKILYKPQHYEEIKLYINGLKKLK